MPVWGVVPPLPLPDPLPLPVELDGKLLLELQPLHPTAQATDKMSKPDNAWIPTRNCGRTLPPPRTLNGMAHGRWPGPTRMHTTRQPSL
ncbi:MAG: hypothetical protein ACYCPM_12860 [Acidobacteriaceae bacterium]